MISRIKLCNNAHSSIGGFMKSHDSYEIIIRELRNVGDLTIEHLRSNYKLSYVQIKNALLKLIELGAIEEFNSTIEYKNRRVQKIYSLKSIDILNDAEEKLIQCRQSSFRVNFSNLLEAWRLPVQTKELTYTNSTKHYLSDESDLHFSQGSLF